MTNTDPVTTGELVRRFDRMESNIYGRLDTMESDLVHKEILREVLRRVDDDLDDMRDHIKQQETTRRQIITGFLLIVLGEIAALTISLTNLASRTGIAP